MIIISVNYSEMQKGIFNNPRSAENCLVFFRNIIHEKNDINIMKNEGFLCQNDDDEQLVEEFKTKIRKNLILNNIYCLEVF